MSDFVLGIDLGTSTTIASVVLDGIPIVIPLSDRGDKIIPSVVAFMPDQKSVLVGEDAKKERASLLQSTVFSIKRVMGKKFSQDESKLAIARFPFKVIESHNDSIAVEVFDKHFSPQEISSILLKKVKASAEKYLGCPVDKAVITVPANFNETQRRATKIAGNLAGFDVLRIINEPTAAALSYGFGNSLNQRVAVFDFGGGTFDITILEVKDNFFEVLSSDGDSFLGGDDIDNTLVEFMLIDIEDRFGADLRNCTEAYIKMITAAENAKIELTTNDYTSINISDLPTPDGGDINYNLELSKELFEEIITPIIQQTFSICTKALNSAHMKVEELDAIIMVGGSSKMPVVQQKVADFFKKEPCTGIETEQVVAMGAAIFGNSLISEYKEETPVLLDVTPLAVGVGTIGDYVEILIEKNEPLPIERTSIFTNAVNNQTLVKISIFQGESNKKSKSLLMGEIILSELRPAMRGDLKIEVTFEIDTNGVMNVSAVDLETGKSQIISLNILGLE